MDNTKVDISKIEILEARISSCKIDNPSGILMSPNDILGFENKISLSQKVNTSKKLIKLIYNIKTIALSKKKSLNGKLSGEFELEFVFCVSNLDKLLGKDSTVKKPVVSSELGVILVGIGFSTARGMIAENVKGTWMSNALLPIIQPIDLMRDTMEKRTNP